MPTYNTFPQYHRQETVDYCGAACAQMVLAGTDTGILDQGGLYVDCHGQGNLDPQSSWYSAPDGLEWTLNDRHLAAADAYHLVAPDSEPAVSRAICWSISANKVPSIALISGNQHWVVVHTVETSAAPLSADDSTYAIEALLVYDPFPTLAGTPPPPHSPADVCETTGFSETFYPYYNWIQNAMTGVSAGYWKDKYLAVVAAKPKLSPPYLEPRMRLLKLFAQKIWKRVWPPPLPLPHPFGTNGIDAARARAFAIKGIDRYQLSKYDAWARSLAGAKPGDGVRVRRLDRGNDYFIVTFRSGEDPRVLVLVDAKTGEFLLATLAPSTGPARIWLSPAEARRRIPGDQDLSGDPFLVWQPCLESPVPYFPFHQFTTDSGKKIFVRVDGEIFNSLTTDIAGA